MKLRNKRTGEIKDVESLGHAESLRRDFGYQVTLSWSVMDHLDTCRTYKTLAELNEEWEDYAPKEPLIKDKKIRKAVRAWAEANDFGRVFYEYDFSNDVARFIVCEVVMVIEADELLEQYRWYTIAELCGEEEECSD